VARLGKCLRNIPLFPVILDEQIKLFNFLFHPVKFIKMKEFVDRIIKSENLETTYHRYGGIEFHHGKKEIAHIHSNGLLDIPFPRRIRDKLTGAGWCEWHHLNPSYDWISFYFTGKTNTEIPVQLIKWSRQLKMKIKSASEILDEIDFFTPGSSTT
jgi:hypothetical protein